jgi:hypothetical protein
MAVGICREETIMKEVLVDFLLVVACLVLIGYFVLYVWPDVRVYFYEFLYFIERVIQSYDFTPQADE